MYKICKQKSCNIFIASSAMKPGSRRRVRRYIKYNQSITDL